MSERLPGQRRFLRAARTAGPIHLGVDGRPRVPDDPLSGMVGGSPEETAEAANIVEEARRLAEEISRRALLEAAALREHAERSGYEQGYAHGAAEARGELAEALALVQRAAGEGKALRDDLARRAEHEIIDMVIAALRAILGERVQHDEDVVHETVHRALARAGTQNVVRVRVHPDEAGRVSAVLAEASGTPPPFEVLPDGSIGLGGCVVDTRHGRVDARLDAQLDVIARLLREALPPLPGEETGAEARNAA